VVILTDVAIAQPLFEICTATPKDQAIWYGSTAQGMRYRAEMKRSMPARLITYWDQNVLLSLHPLNLSQVFLVQVPKKIFQMLFELIWSILLSPLGI
jgi:hypothetical protein